MIEYSKYSVDSSAVRFNPFRIFKRKSKSNPNKTDWLAPETWVAGQVVESTMLNASIPDNFDLTLGTIIK